MATIRDILLHKGATRRLFPCMMCGALECRLGEPVCSDCIDKEARATCLRCGGSGIWMDLACPCKDHGDDEAKAARGE